MQIYNFTDVRNNFKSVLDRVSDDADVAVITRRDSEAVVIMAQKHYDSMMETLYLLSSPANASHLMRSLEQLERGEAVERELLDEQDC
ncbi:type II toxin-antitoxin system Phd/YefM family antitoxin [Acinetobacter venetianus]|uniref:type II toxin-antitoxin system Phd/YefM family antitoxin n=1 Tax=Acinetobacter venetianus TaxID=52133 RepID=UPI003A909AF9